MAAEQPRTPPPDAGGPTLDRRTFLKGAGLTAGAAAIGASPQVSPIGKSEAIAPLVAGAAVGAAFAAGVVAANWGSDAPEIDEDDVLEDEIYNAAVSVSSGREPWVDEMQSQFVDRSTNQTPYANAAWQNIRAEATKVIVNGGSQTEAEQAAIDALDKQTSISIINNVERWNAWVKGVLPSVVKDVENGIGVFSRANSGGLASVSDVTNINNTSGSYTSVSAGETSNGNYTAAQTPEIDLPAPVSNLDDRDEPLKVYSLIFDAGNGPYPVKPAMSRWDPGGSDISVYNATHSDLSTRTLVDLQLWSDVFAAIDTAYGNITSDLSTYVEQLYNGLNEGALDASDILSSKDIVEQMADSSEQARLAAEIMAVGGTVPQETGYQATISHPDLASDSLKGWLYPQFGTGEAVPIAAETTLQPEDYDMAYFGYESAVDGEFETRVLSGDKTLEIIDVEGIEDSDKAAESDSADSSAGTDGAVTIWDDSATDKATPDPLKNPSEYDGWIVRIEAANGTTDMVSLSSVTDNGDGTYSVGSTAISSGTEISKVSIEPGADYEQPVTSVSDATNIDTAETKALIEEQRETYEALKEALEEDDPLTGGLLPDGGLPTIPGLGVIGTVGAALLGLAGINAATG